MTASTTLPSPLKLTRLLPGYQVKNLLESGEATALYRGHQEGLDRAVDIKLMPDNAQVPELAKRRFLREAHAMAQLTHPHVVNVYDHGEIPGVCQYIVFEKGDGVPLRMRLTKPMSPTDAFRVLSDIGAAVAYVHEQDIVHRNITVDHVMVDDEGRAKLRDFSLARMEGDETVMSHVGELRETVNKFKQAPEYHAGKEMNHLSDVYSLGVLLYEMLTCKVPKKNFSPPSQIVPVGVRVDKVILRCMHPNPAKRYASVNDLLKAIHPLQKHPEKLGAIKRPFYLRLIPKVLWIFLVSILLLLLIVFF